MQLVVRNVMSHWDALGQYVIRGILLFKPKPLIENEIHSFIQLNLSNSGSSKRTNLDCSFSSSISKADFIPWLESSFTIWESVIRTPYSPSISWNFTWGKFWGGASRYLDRESSIRCGLNCKLDKTNKP